MKYILKSINNASLNNLHLNRGIYFIEYFLKQWLASGQCLTTKNNEKNKEPIEKVTSHDETRVSTWNVTLFSNDSDHRYFGWQFAIVVSLIRLDVVQLPWGCYATPPEEPCRVRRRYLAGSDVYVVSYQVHPTCVQCSSCLVKPLASPWHPPLGPSGSLA